MPIYGACYPLPVLVVSVLVSFPFPVLGPMCALSVQIGVLIKCQACQVSDSSMTVM